MSIMTALKRASIKRRHWTEACLDGSHTCDICWLCGQGHNCYFKGYRTAWHLTSEENWKTIQKAGWLDLYPSHNDVRRINGPGWSIYTWLHRQTGVPLAGSLLFHIANKSTTRVVRLAVRYEFAETEFEDGHRYSMFHHQQAPLNFWHVQEPGRLLSKPIPLERLTFEKLWDFEAFADA